jgi:DNA-3-methyladenine glycosylase
MRPRPASVASASELARAFRAPLARPFFDRPTQVVARSLLGRWIVRRGPDGWRAGRITETEAYVAGDAANHAVLGPTLRNRSMFGPPGTLYVYRIHQVHCANVVTGFGTAALLRSMEPLAGTGGDPRGPGRLCRALGIDRDLDGTSLIDGPVRIAPGPGPSPRFERGRRVGIRWAADRPLRFAIVGSRWVSAPRIVPAGQAPGMVAPRRAPHRLQ